MKEKLRNNIIWNKTKAFFSKIRNTKKAGSEWWEEHTKFKAYPYIKGCLFFIVATLTFFLPDLLLRNFIYPKVYFVEATESVEFYSDILPFIFSGLWFGFFILFSVFVLPKRWGRILYIFVGALLFIFAFAQYVYFGIFGQFFRLSSLGLAGEGADYLSYALTKVDAVLLKYTVCEIIGLILTAVFWTKPTFKKLPLKIATKVVAIFPIIGLVMMHFNMMPIPNDHKHWDAWKRPGVIYEDFTDANKSLDIMGVYHFALRDAYTALTGDDPYSEEEYAAVDKFIAEKSVINSPNQYTGYFEGKNVIAVMLEGIDDWMITEQSTPVMKYMMENGINFSNYYAPQHGTGLTLGAEFCFHTGYYTPKSGVSPINYTSNYFPYATPRLFAEKGYSVNSYHFNNSEFYNRGLMHNTMGYEKYYSFLK